MQGYWKWGAGWLDAAGFLDFAGSGVVHMCGAAAALAGVTLAAAGPAWAFFVNFVSFGAVPVALWLKLS